jgi:alpha-L-fucosidase
MKVNQESIYETTASPFKRLPWGRCTTRLSRRGATLYLHVFDWPADGALVIPGLKNEVRKAWLLSDPKKRALPVRSDAEHVTVTVPAQAPDLASSTVVLALEGPPLVEDPGLTQSRDGLLTLAAAEARLHGQQVRYETGPERDNIGFWLNPADWVDWDVRITRPGKFTVSAQIAALGSGSFEVVAGESRLKAAAPKTGNYGKFDKVTVGTVEIAKAGPILISVRPVKKGWEPMNLKSLTFTPAD